MPVSYEIGTGIGEVTDPAAGLPLQGMVDEDQIATGVESPLYARAFVVAERPSVAEAGCVAIIVADIWAGTHRVKDGVLRRLAASHQGVYTEENVLLAGTHTHSAPGGFSGNLLYDFNFDIGGCDEATVTCIVDGCVRAVEMAHANLAPDGSTSTRARSPTVDAIAQHLRTCATRRPSAIIGARTPIARCCC